MKLTSFIAIVGIFSLAGIAHAEEGKKPKKVISPEILAKYDKDKDGKLSKEEKAEMKKDKEAEPKVEKKKDKKKKDAEPKVEEKKAE